jgi:hypothetical protein
LKYQDDTIAQEIDAYLNTNKRIHQKVDELNAGRRRQRQDYFLKEDKNRLAASLTATYPPEAAANFDPVTDQKVGDNIIKAEEDFAPITEEPKIVLEQRWGIAVSCRRCLHQWKYFKQTPKIRYYITCPNCHTSIRINNNGNVKTRK